MPRYIPPYFPVVQGFNHRADVRKLRKHFDAKQKNLGAVACLVWQEILSRTDATEGLLKGSYEDIVDCLLGVCCSPAAMRLDYRSNYAAAHQMVDWFVAEGWLINDRDGLRVANHLKYHRWREDKRRTRGGQSGPSVSPVTSPPSYPSFKKKLYKEKVGEISESERSGIDAVFGGESEQPGGEDEGVSSPPQSLTARPEKTAEEKAAHTEAVRRQADAILGSNGAKPPGGDLVDPPGLEEPDPLDPFSSLRSLDPEQFEVAAAELRQRAREYGLDPAIIEAGIDKAREGKA